jgi:hypothetical protein
MSSWYDDDQHGGAEAPRGGFASEWTGGSVRRARTKETARARIGFLDEHHQPVYAVVTPNMNVRSPIANTAVYNIQPLQG